MFECLLNKNASLLNQNASVNSFKVKMLNLVGLNLIAKCFDSVFRRRARL